MMPVELKGMITAAADLARKAGGTMDDIATAAGLQYGQLLDMQCQLAELHSDVAELWMHLRKMKDGAKDEHV